MQASRPKQFVAPKKNTRTHDSLFKFYVSLHIQKPESKMAKNWIKKHKITKKEIEDFKKKLK